ncbi:hypothetical protein, partial [Angustibacter aerolatus]
DLADVVPAAPRGSASDDVAAFGEGRDARLAAGLGIELDGEDAATTAARLRTAPVQVAVRDLDTDRAAARVALEDLAGRLVDAASALQQTGVVR